MMTSPFPQNFEEWKYCITVECGIPLSASFITQRLSVWRNESHEETRRFRQRFGDNYWRSVIGWFAKAEQQLAKSKYKKDIEVRAEPSKEDRGIEEMRPKRKSGNIRKSKMMKIEKVRDGKLDPLSKMGRSKLTGQELQRYYRDNPKAKKAARDKKVKLGIELALDLGGNMNMAMKEIEKLKRGLTKHPEVDKALRFANEENMNESNIDAWLEDRGEEYKKFFNKMLKKFGVNSPAELSPEKKKEFFNKIEKDYDKELPKNDDGDESVKLIKVDARRKQFKEKLRKLGYSKKG